MKLYSIHDYPDCPRGEEEAAHWQAVWAESEEEAIALYWKKYGGEAPEGEGEAVVAKVDDGVELLKYAPGEPGIEGRYEALRLAGWRCEGESACDNCGLYAMDIPDYEVCANCYICRDCGCECDQEEDS